MDLSLAGESCADGRPSAGFISTEKTKQYVELLGRTPADVGDESVADALADLELKIIDRHIQEVRDIEAAKARIVDRSLGICIACKGDIDFARPLAYPTAKRCLSCQQRRERNYAHEPTPRL